MERKHPLPILIDTEYQFYSSCENWHPIVETMLNFEPGTFEIRQGIWIIRVDADTGQVLESKPCLGYSIWHKVGEELKPRKEKPTGNAYVTAGLRAFVGYGDSATEVGLTAKGFSKNSFSYLAAPAVGPFPEAEAQSIAQALNAIYPECGVF